MTEKQRKQYINIIDYIGVDENNNQHNEYTYKLPIDFIQSDRDKYVVVRKLRLVNPQGQLDVGCSLCGNLGGENSYTYGILEHPYIIASNEISEKVFKVSSNLKYLKFWFDDYMGIQIYTSNQTDKWYYTLELELIY